MTIMVRLQSRSGTVHKVDRLVTPWRGEHGERITALNVGGIPVRYGGTPSVGVGDVVTVVGYSTALGIRAQAIRNESTDVSYVPRAWPPAAVGVALLGVAAPLLGFPAAFLLVPLGGMSLLVALHHHRVRWLLDAQPSRHAAPVRAPRHSMGHGSQR